MKIKPEDYAQLEFVIRAGYSKTMRDNYRKRGLSNMRFRWDCLYASQFAVCRLYGYLNDSHIDTALRNIIKGIENGEDNQGS